MDDRLRVVEIELARVGQRVDDHEGDFGTLVGPLVKEVHEIRWDQGKMRESVDAAHGAIRALSERLDREREERIRGQAERKAELEEATAARNAEMARMEKERRQRDEEHAVDRERQRRDFRVKYIQIMAGIGGIFLTSLGGVAVAYISQRGGIK